MTEALDCYFQIFLKTKSWKHSFGFFSI